jgi:hypothetical protein
MADENQPPGSVPVVGARRPHSAAEFLSRQLLQEVVAWGPQASTEALARLFAATYRPEEEQEATEIVRAVEQSLARARKRQWTVGDFLHDALRRGRVLVRRRPARALAILEEAGEGVQRMEDLFGLDAGLPVGLADDTDTWHALREWLPLVRRTLG